MMNKMKSNKFFNTMGMVLSALVDAKAVATTLPSTNQTLSRINGQ
ncbi:hypothetical protein [Bacillus mycoides]|nr:hypothetical protein [Bacillus mycoides]